jgi:TonB family protein
VLEIPGEWRRRHARAVQSVDLDVLVDDTGEVSDVDCTAGCSDSLLVEAARRCARTMRFYPALRGGWPVAVWCRQRFDFGAK